MTDGGNGPPDSNFDEDYVEWEGPFFVSATGGKKPFAQLFVGCCGTELTQYGFTVWRD